MMRFRSWPFPTINAPRYYLKIMLIPGFGWDHQLQIWCLRIPTFIRILRVKQDPTFFKGRVAHGALSVGYISSVLGNLLPGPGSIYLSQEVKFLAPVRIGDTITATVELIELVLEKIGANSERPV